MSSILKKYSSVLGVSAVLTVPDYMEIKWIVSCSNFTVLNKNVFMTLTYIYFVNYYQALENRLAKLHLKNILKNHDSIQHFFVKIIKHIKITMIFQILINIYISKNIFQKIILKIAKINITRMLCDIVSF